MASLNLQIQFFIFFSLIGLTSCVAQKNTQLEYDIVSTLSNGEPVLEIKFDVTSDERGLVELRFENASWGDNDIYACIKEFNVIPSSDSIVMNRDESIIRIHTKPLSKATVQYQIKQDFQGAPLNEYRYRPIIDSSYFHILGMRLFMFPENTFKSDTSKVYFQINYDVYSQKGILHSSIGSGKYQEALLTQEELYATIFVGGDYRKTSFLLNADTVFFLTRGDWNCFEEQTVQSILSETIEAQHSFWNDSLNGNFSVVLTPTFETWNERSKANSIGGSALTNSFISFASNNDGTTINNIRWLYNHELMHKWIARTIINENEVEQYWFSEGFTDYYAYKLMLKNNHLSVSEYISIINNKVIIPHSKDPNNDIPNSQLTFENYWGSYAEYGLLPYRRGFLYALLLDTKIKEKFQYQISLDQVMHDLYTMARANSEMRLNHEVFMQVLAKYLDEKEVIFDFKNYIIEGNVIEFSEDLPPGIALNTEDNIPLFIITTSDLSELNDQLKK